MLRSLLRPLLLVLAGTVVLVGLVLAAYLVGRAQCPPPDWWAALFAVDGDWGCVA